MTEKLTLNAAQVTADVQAEIKELKRTLRHFMQTYHDQMADVSASLSDVADALAEHKKQIDRRPVDMEQMKLELYGNVERQVERELLDKMQDFDRVVSDFFYNARLVPKGSVLYESVEDFRVSLSKEDE